MRGRIVTGLLLIAVVATCVGRGWGQDNAIEWNFDTGNWNDSRNWNPPFVPSEPLGGFEIAVITNGGTAVLDSTLEPPGETDPVAGVVLGNNSSESGFLQVRDGGTLDIIQTGNPLVGGQLQIGQSGRGVLDILDGGQVSTHSLSIGGSTDSELNLSGNASLLVVDDASLARNTRITGPDVAFATVGATIPSSGTLIAEITAPSHSPITASDISLRGTLQVEFSGHEPQLGQSWDIIDADQLSGQFDTLNEGATANGFSEPFKPGDANLDGVVNATDLNALGRNWQTPQDRWSLGDFTADGTVNASDLNQLGQNWQSEISGPAAAAVPEPSSWVLLALAGMAVLVRNKRHSRR